MFSLFSKNLRKFLSPIPLADLRDNEKPRSHLFNLAIQLWIVLLIALTIKDIGWPLEHSNYPVYECGARRWWSEKNMYVSGGEQISGVPVDYRYGPTFAIALAPLAFLPTQWGSGLFSWITMAIFFYCARELVRQLLPGRWTPFRQGLYFLLLLLTATRMLWALQINPVVFAAIAGAAIAIKNQRWWTASFLLAIAVHIKIWPIAAALLMIACWPRQLSWRLVAALAIVFAMPLLTKPYSIVFQQYKWWYEDIVGPAQIRHMYRDAWTIWEQIHPPVWHKGYMALQLLAGMLVLIVCLWQKRRSQNPDYLLTLLLGLWAAWQMVFGFATERNTFGMIGPLTAWALVTAIKDRWWLTWMSVTFVLTTVLSNGTVERALSPKIPFILCVHPIGSMLFALWLVGYARRWRDPVAV
jgi:hypothetical protein